MTRHFALCPQTGEVLGSATGNALKRHLRRTLARDLAWNREHPEDNLGPRQWVFFHCREDQLDALYKARRLAKRG